jgi:hypothetical protein
MSAAAAGAPPGPLYREMDMGFWLEQAEAEFREMERTGPRRGSEP